MVSHLQSLMMMMMILVCTSSAAVAERPRNVSCLSVRRTSASDLPLRKLNSVLFSSVQRIH